MGWDVRRALGVLPLLSSCVLVLLNLRREVLAEHLLIVGPTTLRSSCSLSISLHLLSHLPLPQPAGQEHSKGCGTRPHKIGSTES